MRPRSCGIIADNMEDFLSQSKNTMGTLSQNFFPYQLFNFAYLSLSEAKQSDLYNDYLSPNMNYSIKLNKTAQKFFTSQHKKPIIPLNFKKVQKKKWGFITQIPQMIKVQ